MRLLNVQTLRLETFDGGPRATYAILSHTWETEEVTYQDMVTYSSSPPPSTSHHRTTARKRAVESKRGFAKIASCCAKARAEGYSYAWIDTCCIDKSSSAELSEAINSMWRWYRDSEVCYAFLGDVSVEGGEGGYEVGAEGEGDGGYGEPERGWEKTLGKSRWFTRGWTLQELVAPMEVVFVDSAWREFGTRETLAGVLGEITGVDGALLRMEKGLGEFSVAQRMSWAAGRTTSRIEDEAYCLMGLFDVNMPLLYGEGRKAFKRLQLEIMRSSTDRSILAWASPDSHGVIEGVLASSPRMFEDCEGVLWNPGVVGNGREGGRGENNLNYNACHDIIGFSLTMEAGVLEPPPSGKAPMVFTEYWGFADGGGMAPEGPKRGRNPLGDLVHFPRDVWELYTHERAFREFDYGFLRHQGRTVVLVMLEGCTKGGGNNGPEYAVGITLCLDAEGLMKRVHFPSRFLIPEHAKHLFTDRVQTLHASLSGTEVLQRPPLPNFAKCMVRVPDLSNLPYELAYTVPAMVSDSAGIWYLERWGEITDQASLELQPCFSLHRNGAARAMAFQHKTDPSLSFMLIFTLVRPPVAAKRIVTTAKPSSVSRQSTDDLDSSLASSIASLTSTFSRTLTVSTTATSSSISSINSAKHTLENNSASKAPVKEQWFHVSFLAGFKALEIGVESDLASALSLLPPDAEAKSAPIYAWKFDLPDPALSLSVKLRKAPKVYNAGLRNYNALLSFDRVRKFALGKGHDGGGGG